MLALLQSFSWQELRQHPWRSAAAVVAVMLGVALALSVHLINASALDEFSQATRAVNGEPDLELRSVQGSLDESVYGRVAALPEISLASPVLEVSTQALNINGQRMALRVLGVDALVVAALAPALTPRLDDGVDRLALFAPDTVFLNASARRLLDDPVRLQSGLQLMQVKVAGSVSAAGAPLAVMDIGAAQELLGRQGQLSRIDLRLRPGIDRAAVLRIFAAHPEWAATLTVAEPGDAQARLGQLSRAYRVNLTVLALVALFTGAFLVFSVLSLSVAKRAQQLALLGVLGLRSRDRLALVLWESLALGGVGSVLGVALGSALAGLALRLLGGDLGGGYFSGGAPAMQWSGWAALGYAALGLLAALAGGWWPARQARDLPLAQSLKGQGHDPLTPGRRWLSLLLIAAALPLTRAPAVFDIPLAAYLSVGLLLLGGISALPWLVALLLDRLAPLFTRWVLPLLALERARRVRASASVAISGVVSALSLAVALTVMVASFRDSVAQWLDRVLPADLYARSARNLGAADTVYFTPEFVQAARQLAGVRQLQASRQFALLPDPSRPAVALIARELADPVRSLPLVAAPLPVPAGQIGIYVSEAMVELHGARPGTVYAPLAKALRPSSTADGGFSATFLVAGVWRDYARQTGSIVIDKASFERLTGDRRANDLALWLAAPADAERVQSALRELAEQLNPGAGQLLEFASAAQIRATSLRIFDRSFAITYWLQAVAIAIGLFGVAASFSAQVLARRKEFGLLVHLGLTRRQVLTLVALEGAVWTALGALAGLGLGLAVSVILVHVVNPQSFHWTMDLMLPWARLLVLCLAVILAGTLTAWLAGRAAASQDPVLAVKEDW